MCLDKNEINKLQLVNDISENVELHFETVQNIEKIF